MSPICAAVSEYGLCISPLSVGRVITNIIRREFPGFRQGCFDWPFGNNFGWGENGKTDPTVVLRIKIYVYIFLFIKNITFVARTRGMIFLRG